jgi:hypothetical protein
VKLIKTFSTPENVIKAIQMTNVLYTRTGNPKGIEDPLKHAKIRGVGPKFVLENKKLLFGIEEVFNPVSLKVKTKQKTLI